MSWAWQVGVREFEEKGSVSVPWNADWTVVSVASPPPSSSPAPSSFAAPLSAVGTKSSPASSSAVPENRGHANTYFDQ